MFSYQPQDRHINESKCVISTNRVKICLSLTESILNNDSGESLLNKQMKRIVGSARLANIS